MWNTTSERDRILFLRSYVTTYLKEEIAEEQLVRKLEPFSRFLQIAAQTSGHLLNYAKVAKDVGVSDQTVRTYFQILEETLLGFVLPAFDRSIWKSVGKTPKFYLFDTWVLRALLRSTDQPFDKNHYAYGLYFEHFIIQELMRRANYSQNEYQFSFLRINDHDEVDFVIDRGRFPEALVEIKSNQQLGKEHTEVLAKVAVDFPDAELFVLSNDPHPKTFGRIRCIHWKLGIPLIFKWSMKMSDKAIPCLG